MTDLQLFNSLTRKKEVFEPIDADHVRLYACGPTVYSYAHIGNARMAVVFDVLSRVLKRIYGRVTYVSNITDVDDKIMVAARESGVAIDEITRKYEAIYNEDMEVLGCAAPDIQPRATQHIGEMIALMETLIERGHAYEGDGHVLFNVPSFPAYGGLSGRSRDDQIAGARVEVAPYKKDAADFVLWKPSSEDEPGWDSPWGRGRPGWHIECSAMAETHLGLPFDIHGGGADLKFPHHENEIAQSCCAQGVMDDLSAFAKSWVHNGFVTVEGEKMSKSLGNITLVHDLIEQGVRGPVIRLALLSAHYRKPLDWSAQALHQADILYEKICKVYTKLPEGDSENAATGDDPLSPSATARQGIFAALLDDLNTPLAFAKLNAFLVQVESRSALQGVLDVLGIEVSEVAENAAEIPQHILDLVEERTEVRATKNYARADEIRDELAAAGYEVEDTPDGPVARKI